MAKMFFVQTFRLKGKALEAGNIEKMRSPEAAIAKAERQAPAYAGVWAFAQEIDAETDTYGDPEPLYHHGTLPDGLLTRD